jgi:hypothetical protein
LRLKRGKFRHESEEKHTFHAVTIPTMTMALNGENTIPYSLIGRRAVHNFLTNFLKTKSRINIS